MPPKKNEATGAFEDPPVEETPVQSMADSQAQQIASLTEMVNRLQGQLEEQKAIPAPAIPAENVIEDGPCDTVNYFAKIAELSFTVSVGGKVKDSKGNMVDPVPEAFAFHNGVMSLSTKKRVFLAEQHAGFGKHFWRTTAMVKPMNKTEYVTGPATAGDVPGKRPQQG